MEALDDSKKEILRLRAELAAAIASCHTDVSSPPTPQVAAPDGRALTPSPEEAFVKDEDLVTSSDTPLAYDRSPPIFPSTPASPRRPIVLSYASFLSLHTSSR